MINEKDVKILCHLRNNARKKITEIADETGICATTIYDRVRGHEKKLFKKYVALLDFSKLGFYSTTNFAIKCSDVDRDRLHKFLLEHPSVNTLHKINYGFDFLAEGVFRGMKESIKFADTLRKDYKIENMHIFNVVEELKKEELLSKPEHFSALLIKNCAGSKD